jgi:hypothetical protein
MAIPLPTTKCEICGAPTNNSFSFGGKPHYCCKGEHQDELFKRVTKKTPKPEK